MKKYEYLEDEATADAAFLAYGKNLENVFENSALAIIELMIDTKNVRVQEVRNVKKEAEDLKSLLYDFLEEIIYFHDAEELVFKKVEVKKVYEEDDKFFIEAVFKGEVFNPDKHEAGSNIKAVTYFGMKIEKKNDNWTAKITLDL